MSTPIKPSSRIETPTKEQVQTAKIKLIHFLKTEKGEQFFQDIQEVTEEAKNNLPPNSHKQLKQLLWTNKIITAVDLGKLDRFVQDVFLAIEYQDRHTFIAHVVHNVFHKARKEVTTTLRERAIQAAKEELVKLISGDYNFLDELLEHGANSALYQIAFASGLKGKKSIKQLFQEYINKETEAGNLTQAQAVFSFNRLNQMQFVGEVIQQVLFHQETPQIL